MDISRVSLEGLNKYVSDTSAAINFMLDAKYEYCEVENLLQRLQLHTAKCENSLYLYRKQCFKLKAQYQRLINDIKVNGLPNGRALYKELRAFYEKEAVKTQSSIKPIDLWEIKQPFKPPRLVLPRDKTRLKSTLRPLFFPSREYSTFSSAFAAANQLKAVHDKTLSDSWSQERLTEVNRQIIEELKYINSFEECDYLWKDVYYEYVDEVRNWLKNYYGFCDLHVPPKTKLRNMLHIRKSEPKKVESPADTMPVRIGEPVYCKYPTVDTENLEALFLTERSEAVDSFEFIPLQELLNARQKKAKKKVNY